MTTTVISYKGPCACTTQQLAQFYGCTEKNLSDNHANNRSRFEEGKHFIKLDGEDLQAFKNKPEIIGLVAKKARHAILWTERGAALTQDGTGKVADSTAMRLLIATGTVCICQEVHNLDVGSRMIGYLKTSVRCFMAERY